MSQSAESDAARCAHCGAAIVRVVPTGRGAVPFWRRATGYFRSFCGGDGYLGHDPDTRVIPPVKSGRRMSTATSGRRREYQVRDHLDARFLASFTRGDDCWLWTGPLSDSGYGLLIEKRGGSQTNHRAHRWSYEHHVGPIPDGLVIDHLCRVRHCVNPLHLEPVTSAENIRRGVSFNGSKTHCKRGHEFTEANTGYQNGGYRYCRTCKQLADSKRWGK